MPGYTAIIEVRPGTGGYAGAGVQLDGYSNSAALAGIRLSTLARHGERNALRVSLEQLARIRSNPFYPYLEQRALAWLESGCAGCATEQPANN